METVEENGSSVEIREDMGMSVGRMAASVGDGHSDASKELLDYQRATSDKTDTEGVELT